MTNKTRKRSNKFSASDWDSIREEFLKSINVIVGLQQLIENFSAKIREIAGAQSVYVVLYEPITNRYAGVESKGRNPELLVRFNFSPSDNLIKWLNVNRCALHVVKDTEVVRFLSEREQELLSKTEIELAVPFIAVNRLTGILFLSEKEDNTHYDSSEIEKIAMLADHAALAIEHALMYQLQEDRLKKLFHADRLATVGELAAGAAHEIRNPLTSIRSTIQYLQKDLSNDRKPLVDGLLEEVDRIDQIIKGLLSFSKSSELHVAIVNIEELLTQTLQLLESELRRYRIDVNRNFCLADPHITGDASQLKQVFLNILLNSIQAMPDGGAIELSVTEDPRSESVASDKHFIRITISDVGVGIPEEDLPKIFDPFYTTKETGTGLGLSISYGIVSKHGGDIEITSRTEGSNIGTTLVICLPRGHLH